jgi:hypothetical protein
MKKTLLILSLIAGTSIAAYAQCTSDETQTTIGSSPSTLPTSCVNTSYDETITVTVQKHVEYQGFTVEANKITINSVTNLHTGFTYECETNDCSVLINETGLTHTCLSIAGTPTETGDKLITIHYTAEVNNPLGGTADVQNSYEATVSVKNANDAECNLQNIFEVNNSNNTLGVYPNPSNGQELNFNSTLHNISIVDQLGNIVYSSKEANNIQLNAAVKGIYFLKADEGIEKIIIK